MCSYKYKNAVEKVSEIKYNIIYVSYRIYKLMDLYISHDKSKRLNIYLFGLFFILQYEKRKSGESND